MSFKISARLIIKNEDPDIPGVFGHGVVLLLEGVARQHSLNKAAKSMGMAYSKAWRIIKEAEAQLGCQLLDRKGAHGSTLTPEGERAVAAYNELADRIAEVIATEGPRLMAGFKDDGAR